MTDFTIGYVMRCVNVCIRGLRAKCLPAMDSPLIHMYVWSRVRMYVHTQDTHRSFLSAFQVSRLACREYVIDTKCTLLCSIPKFVCKLCSNHALPHHALPSASPCMSHTTRYVAPRSSSTLPLLRPSRTMSLGINVAIRGGDGGEQRRCGT